MMRGITFAMHVRRAASRTGRATLLVSLVLAPLCAGGQADPAQAQTATDASSAAVFPVEPAAATGAVFDLLYARPFTLEQPYLYAWTKEQPEITGGTLLVLAVAAELARPRDVDVPVLFAGDTPVHLTNTGYPSGRAIVFVPAWVDLASAPFYFGSLELPERIDRERGAAELRAAAAQGAAPFPAETVTRALAAGGEAARFTDSLALFRAAADLIDRYAPDESHVAERYRVPLVGE